MVIWDDGPVVERPTVWERLAAAVQSYLERYRKFLGAW